MDWWNCDIASETDRARAFSFISLYVLMMPSFFLPFHIGSHYSSSRLSKIRHYSSSSHYGPNSQTHRGPSISFNSGDSLFLPIGFLLQLNTSEIWPAERLTIPLQHLFNATLPQFLCVCSWWTDICVALNRCLAESTRVFSLHLPLDVLCCAYCSDFSDSWYRPYAQVELSLLY